MWLYFGNVSYPPLGLTPAHRNTFFVKYYVPSFHNARYNRDPTRLAAGSDVKVFVLTVLGPEFLSPNLADLSPNTETIIRL